jgi:hypothetical protein
MPLMAFHEINHENHVFIMFFMILECAKLIMARKNDKYLFNLSITFYNWYN